MTQTLLIGITTLLLTVACSGADFGGSGDSNSSDNPQNPADSTTAQEEGSDDAADGADPNIELDTDTGGNGTPPPEHPKVDGCNHAELWQTTPTDISTAEQFATISSNTYYRLINDIDLASLAGPLTGLENTIIDGQNFTVSNYSFDGGVNSAATLIPTADCVVINSLNLANVTLTASEENLAAIIGSISNSYVANSTAQGTVTRALDAGLLVGDAATTTFVGVTVSGSMTMKGGGGGLAAKIRSSVSPDGTIKPSRVSDCHADMTIMDTGVGSGGIGTLIGYATDVVIEDSSGRGSVTSDGDAIGGFIGGTTTSANVETGAVIRRSSFTGSVKGRQGVGGFAGNLRYPAEDSFAIASVEGGSRIGGFVGYLALKGQVDRVYAAGAVTGTGAKSLVGEHEVLGVANAYFDQDTCTCEANAAGTALVTSAFGDPASFVNWDFGQVWTIDATTNRPALK